MQLFCTIFTSSVLYLYLVYTILAIFSYHSVSIVYSDEFPMDSFLKSLAFLFFIEYLAVWLGNPFWAGIVAWTVTLILLIIVCNVYYYIRHKLGKDKKGKSSI